MATASTDDRAMVTLSEHVSLVDVLSRIPRKTQHLFSTADVELTTVDISDRFLLFGNSNGAVYVYHRGENRVEKLLHQVSSTEGSSNYLELRMVS